MIDLEVILFLYLLTSERWAFRALKRLPLRQKAVHSLWSRLLCGPLKMRRVPEKAVFGTEYPFRTGNACFLHRMPLMMRRVPQEAFLSTECVFRTVEACFWYGALPKTHRTWLSGAQKSGWQLPLRNFELYKRKRPTFSRPLFRYIKNLFLAGNNFLGSLHDMRSVKSVCLEKFCRST